MKFIIKAFLLLKAVNSVPRCKTYLADSTRFCCGPAAGDDYCEISADPIFTCKGFCTAANSEAND